MHKLSIKNSYSNGQVLPLVLIVLTIILGAAAYIASQSIKTSRRTSSSDTSSRALAAAEGGAEKVLVTPIEKLEEVIASGECTTSLFEADLNAHTPPEVCYTDFSGVSAEDNIDAESIMAIERLGTSSEHRFRVPQGEVREVRLTGTTGALAVCWSSNTVTVATDNDVDSILLYSLYSGSSIDKAVVGCGSSCSSHASQISTQNSIYPDTSTTYKDSAGNFYALCFDVNASGIVGGLRIQSVGADSEVGVFVTDTSTLPSQGFKITSLGKLQDTKTNETITRKIVVERSYPYLPGMFDYAMYSNNGTFEGAEPL
ncbi:MAG: hypothetical protein R3B92_00770 [Patescibacteria group bacterium]|uniref:Uncharacterized protein n=1 Tax=candidate division WWE3 bacterium TaxID=2053526 RepID=A0A955ED50_UNCKA|nr:hypothetical protein [candidate division WWE3 bacterium]